ncbi:dihydroorotate dehydrogenase [Schaereria dolodes]|nr:dihydroorotate dehydrogenase [Schaereria dolodes]
MPAFKPLLLNSSNPWASTAEDLQALYACPYTGAVTIRTSLLNGFSHDDKIHQHCFFDVNSMTTGLDAANLASEESTQSSASEYKLDFSNASSRTLQGSPPHLATKGTSSLNTLGYSPVPLAEYIRTIQTIQRSAKQVNQSEKPVIFSVTGSPTDVQQSYYKLVHGVLETMTSQATWLMEINLSCPNIHSKPPPAYSKADLCAYISAIRETRTSLQGIKLEVGIKLPPYTYQHQFDNLIDALLENSVEDDPHSPVSFITATNTLGSCLLLDPSTSEPTINSATGTGIGGLAGAAIHPLALGNVRTIRRMLDSYPRLRSIKIIGVGGVSDGAGFKRMLAAGASAVAVGTALGSHGMPIFEKIMREAGEMEV